jgi:predicted ATPase
LNSGYRLRLKRYKELDLGDPLVVQLLTGRAFDDADFGAKLDLSNVPTQSRVLIVPMDGSIELRPNDVGIGISQVVPVIVTALDGAGRFVAIEQPELHLHPKLQAELADLFIEAAKGQAGHVVLLETHSELIPLRIMRRIRETFEQKRHERLGLTEDDVAIYYVEPFNGTTVVTRLNLSERGQLLDPWPEGFFEEGYRERFSD